VLTFINVRRYKKEIKMPKSRKKSVVVEQSQSGNGATKGVICAAKGCSNVLRKARGSFLDRIMIERGIIEQCLFLCPGHFRSHVGAENYGAFPIVQSRRPIVSRNGHYHGRSSSLAD
jgi:hypothetical protein